jgi:hypothetical protein
MGSGYRVFTAGEVLTASNVQNYLQDQAVMVFGGTAARSSAIGTANFEEGMLTYLTDVDKLQVYTGAAFADVYPPAASAQGLTLINTTSFSAVASQSINTVFNSTYDNYKVILQFTTLTGGLTLRLRASGSDNSTSNYYSNAIQNNWNADALVVAAGRQSAANIINMYGSGPVKTFELYAPNLNTVTELYSSFSREGTTCSYVHSAIHNANYQADGFTFAATSMTGNVSVYGFNK